MSLACSLAYQVVGSGRARYDEYGGFAVVARLVPWKGRLARVGGIGPRQLMASDGMIKNTSVSCSGRQKERVFEIDQTRKHFVPKLYLRGFGLSGRPEQVYVFDKKNPQEGVTVRSIANVEVSKDAYSVANDRMLTAREVQWSKILNSLKELSVPELNDLISDRTRSATLRAWLARFVVDSKLRSRGFREQMRESAKAMRLQLRAEIEAIEAGIVARHPDLVDQCEVVFSLLREMAGVDSDRKFGATIASPVALGEKGKRLYRWYEEGSWRFDAALAGRAFITSDIPSNSWLLGPEPEHRNCMWFVMPLTAELRMTGLCGDFRVQSGLAPRLVEMGEREMDLANMCVSQSAERFVYASSKAEILRASEQSVG